MMKQIFISRTLALVFILIFTVHSNCIIGESGQFYFDVKNNRNNSIKLIYFWNLGYKHQTERMQKINPGETGSDGGFGRGEHLSDDLAYVIIKDNDDNEIMNLSGKALDDAFKLVVKEEYDYTYRLEVN